MARDLIRLRSLEDLTGRPLGMMYRNPDPLRSRRIPGIESLT
jgi:hypothetical protein